MQLFNFHGLDAVSFVTLGFGQNEDFSATIFLIAGSGGRGEREWVGMLLERKIYILGWLYSVNSVSHPPLSPGTG